MAPQLQYKLSSPPSDAISSLKFAPSAPTRLLVSSWDKKVYLYDAKDREAGGKLIEKYEHRAPVLDVCFGADDDEAFSAGMDWQVKKINLETGEQTVLSAHGAPVRSVVYSKEHLSCMPNDDGYATSSIEGRVAVEWFDPSAESQNRKYAFKCHRQPDPEGDGTDIVYPVNALAFHPVHGSFASGGGDGVVALWDAVAKRRIRQYQKYQASVAALAFSSDGKYLAVGVCPGFENGQEDYTGEGKTDVYIRELGETEAKGKAPK
ncbi:mitotic checkpoint protein BUB3 [Drepanopeziza brunnea f. sp. 'multigermtubi' MB_m1]|uniref:Mitotic checkpoint protein BUB3 n=1 Tax=Marssonina brunnea f. sp. multigermtubi (strain MB_m1) TaxID=1072389 RepID=K1X4P2_MARBU|nr:mitotic checkpoint protein BUB3 [Drepanopeziza brunnea f. sp. 'multigermtubi' MB_m1]EKD20052.1 mitotic checkpoint protein BUB3 [Drepanopeziza brunnea f. sp. 'multigermtubi' MB_m1]